MALKADLSHLPAPAKTRTDGRPPDANPRFVHVLAVKWAEENAERDAAYQRRTRFHLSDAGKCSRAVAYAALEAPASDPMDLTGVHNTRLGQMIHDAWQEALRETWPDAEIEARQVILDGDGSGYSDAIVTDPDGGPASQMAAETCFDCGGSETARCPDHAAPLVVSVELKSTGGYAYKMAVGERGAPQGPKHEHIVQGALNAKAKGADEMVVGYISKEAISVNAAKRKKIDELGRFVAEWTFTREEFEPIAAAEEARIRGILDLLDEGWLPARKVPGGDIPSAATVVDPGSGRWRTTDPEGQILDTGSYWGCNYCKWQSSCTQTASGRIPITAQVRVSLGLPEASNGEGGEL